MSLRSQDKLNISTQDCYDESSSGEHLAREIKLLMSLMSLKRNAVELVRILLVS